jgi:AAA domain
MDRDLPYLMTDEALVAHELAVEATRRNRYGTERPLREAGEPQPGYEPPGERAPDDKPVKITPTPFKWRDPSTFPRRQFVYGRHYVRQFLGVTVAPTKVGKSSICLVEAVAMAAGRNLLGIAPIRPMRVWYWNGEDPMEEIERRVLAICLHYGIGHHEVEENLFLDSGRDTEIIVAMQTKTGAVIATPVEDALTAALIDGKFDVFILDPAVSIHRVSENDNMAIDAVAKTFGRIGGKANVAIEAVHHTRKLGGAAATMEDSRGASAWTAAARDVRVLNRMTRDEGEKAGIEAGKERFYFRSDTDGNLSPPSTAEWFSIASQGLGNGSGGPIDDQDYVGVVTAWKLPDAFEGVTVSDLRKVQAAIGEGRWRENTQAKDWAGHAVARVLNLDAKNKAHRAKIAALLKTWIGNGMFVVVEGLDAKREKRDFIEVGMPADD